MATNTNPISKKIYTRRSWRTISFNQLKHNELQQDIYIRELIHGIFLRFFILTSEVQINKFATGVQVISFMCIPLKKIGKFIHQKKFKKNSFGGISEYQKRKEELKKANIRARWSNKIKLIKKLISIIIQLKFNIQVKYVILQTPHIFSSTKILADYIGCKLKMSPRNHRYLLKKTFKHYIEYKRRAILKRKVKLERIQKNKPSLFFNLDKLYHILPRGDIGGSLSQ